jgi:hypothetical protein
MHGAGLVEVAHSALYTVGQVSFLPANEPAHALPGSVFPALAGVQGVLLLPGYRGMPDLC